MKEPQPSISEEKVLNAMRAAGGSLCTMAVSFLLNESPDDVGSVLESLAENGLAKKRTEYHTTAWKPAETLSNRTDASVSGGIRNKLLDYVLDSPGASLPETVTVLGWNDLEVDTRARLLRRAVNMARELGEFRILTHFLNRILALEEAELPEQEIREILEMIQPRRLKGLDLEKARNFLSRSLSLLGSRSGRALAMARLGELELMDNRAAQAEENLRKALRISLDTDEGNTIPVILETMVEVPRDFHEMKKAVQQVDEVLEWVSRLHDQDMAVRILAAAAAAYSGLRKQDSAQKTILEAMNRIPEVSPETKMALEWSRARIFSASGREKAAMNMLHRALLLAETVNDQLAVMEILNTMMLEMRERRGYTLRSLIRMMKDVAGKASMSGNVSNSLYALNHLVDMMTRTLRFRDAMNTLNEISAVVESSELLVSDPSSEWYRAYLGLLRGESDELERADCLLPGAGAFLRALRGNSEPSPEAEQVAESLRKLPSSDSLIYGLVMSMEAFSRGHGEASRQIASVLDSSWKKLQDDPYISWKLCVSGILASQPGHADDFFHSAQLLARQMDRLLLLWLVLRCRCRLNLRRQFKDEAGILLLLSELDDYAGAGLEDFFGTGAAERKTRLMEMAGAGTDTLKDIRDRIEEKLEEDSIFSIEEVNERSDRISSRSEISRSLETLGRLLKADRILAVNVSGDSVKIVEGCGAGKWRMPCEESRESLTALPKESMMYDIYGETPFGSRRYRIFPLEQSVQPTQKRLVDHLSYSRGRNYILAESDSPFDCCGGIPGFIVESLCGQIGSALLLRSRETMAYNDIQTGAVTGSVWMKQLDEILSTGGAGSFSLLLVDIDNFKEVNRIFGYKAGDVILRKVSAAITETLRPFDIVGRLDSGLFGVILLEEKRENLRAIAARVCGTVSGGDLRPDRVPLTVTAGGSVSSGSNLDPFEIIQKAWAALRQGKRSGGGRAVIWSEGTPEPEDGLPPALFSTGDPGWDHSVYEVVLKVLKRGELHGNEIAELFRDALRCQFVYLENAAGTSFMTGSRILRSIPGELPAPKPDHGGVEAYGSVLGRYYVLSCVHGEELKLVAAWEEERPVSKGLRNIFEALARLARYSLPAG